MLKNQVMGKNLFNGIHYLPNDCRSSIFLKGKCNLCTRTKLNLTFNQNAMFTAIDLCQDENVIYFKYVDNLTHHWLPEERQKAIDDLVENDFLKINNSIPFSLEPEQEKTFDTKINRLFNSEGVNIRHLIDYLPQLAFGTYLACLIMEINGIIEPRSFQEHINCDKETMNRGFALLEKFGYLEKKYRFCKDYYTDSVAKTEYYIFRKSLFHDFREVKDYHEYFEV